MSSDEKLSKIERDINTIKRWWPLLVIIVASVMALIKITFSATSTWDNTVAKKNDIAVLSEQLTKVSNQLTELSNNYKVTKGIDAHQKTIDSGERENLKTALAIHIRIANNQYHELLNKFKQIASYHEQYYYDKNGRRNISIVQNP